MQMQPTSARPLDVESNRQASVPSAEPKTSPTRVWIDFALILCAMILAMIGVLIIHWTTKSSTEEHELHFSYEGHTAPKHWGGLKEDYKMCSEGQAQSPIDIETAKTTSSGGKFSSIITNSPHEAEFTLSHPHESPTFACKESGLCGTIKVDDTTYSLAQFHFHTPSENTVDGNHYTMEMHMVHCTGKCVVGTDKFVVIGVLFDMATKDDNAALAPFWGLIPLEEAEVTVNVTTLYPTGGYFQWSGSLTTPPCTEGIYWMLSTDSQSMSVQQRAAYYGLIGGYPGNSRPVQPVNGRKIRKFS